MWSALPRTGVVTRPTEARIAVVGATGAVGTVTLQLLAERGYENVRAFASARSAGSAVGYGDATIVVEQAEPDALSAGDLDLCLFSVGTTASRELVPHASGGGAICVDKSSAYRLVDGYPLVVPEVNGARALEALERDRIVANPNCCTIPLTCVLQPLHEAAGLTSVHVATYQSVSGAGAHRMRELEAEPPADHNVLMDWDWIGEESDEESKLVAETRKIMELPDLPVSATCVRVPVMVGHAEAVWAEFAEPLSPTQASEILADAPSVRVLELPEFPTPRDAAGGDEVLVGRIRGDRARENGLSLFLASDNLRKGAALNAIQIAELLLAGVAAA
jgi:aspartate-semialdehyde dehydrogenase